MKIKKQIKRLKREIKRLQNDVVGLKNMYSNLQPLESVTDLMQASQKLKRQENVWITNRKTEQLDNLKTELNNLETEKLFKAQKIE
jgi:conjugal transfer/entry exclusion protein